MSTKTILFLDNDREFLDVWSRLLMHRGYNVITTPELEEAAAVLQTRRVHLAILDIRVLDDSNPQDTSGLQLALRPEFLSVPKIVLTAFPHFKYATAAMHRDQEGRQAVLTLLDKADGPQQFLATVADAFANHIPINWSLSIRFSQPSSFPHLARLIDPELPDEWMVERAAELEDLFRMLFYANEQITIGRILRQGQDQIEVEVYAYGGNDLKGQFVVACGQREAIAEEVAHYNKHTPGDADLGSTQLARDQQTMHFGAAAYRLLGGGELENMETLAVYYSSHDIDEIRRTIDHLYAHALARWHQSNRALKERITLRSLYLIWLNLDGKGIQASLSHKLETLCSHAQKLLRTRCEPKSLTFYLPQGECHFPNPIQALVAKDLHIEKPVVFGVTHGRINLESVLVNKKRHAWMFGFRHAERGPLFRDFISLEDALAAFAARGTDLEEFYHLEQRFLSVDSLQASIATDDLTSYQRKRVETVMHVRSLAAQQAGDDIHTYFIGLLAASLAHIAQFDETVQYYSNRELIPYVRSLLRAAMLAKKLAPNTSQSARDDLPDQSRNSLWVDEETGRVWVEGREIDLTPQELQLLLYFYQRPGVLCTKKQILAEGLQDSSELYHVRNKFDNAIGRLRQKIEPNPEHPKYLKTVRGRGFRFEI